MKKFRVHHYEIYSEKIKAHTQMKFVLLSDLHGLSFGKDNSSLLAAVRESMPDAVLCVGDLNVRTIPETLQVGERLLLSLAKDFPVYYSLGNHEYKFSLEKENKETYRRYERILRRGGVHLLRNEKEQAVLGDNLCWITGLELPMKYYKKPKSPGLSKKSLEGLVGTPWEEGFHVLLAHNPKYGNTYFSWGADLTVSGHYHGGIVRLSEHRGLSCPQYMILPPFCCGDFHRGQQSMIVSAGLGEHTIPVRIHNPRELLTVTVKPLEKNTGSM